ncbi:YdjY domain-containing protein [Planctomicrobium sp. SH668]|uniref:YdjY domain-containing protein n=1 Tax=Planctomicrobium sp. SH668 TaxID=3448126 RepID=UPI003F5CA203
MLRLATLLFLSLVSLPLFAQEEEQPAPRPAPKVPASAVPLNKQETILLDKEKKTILLKSTVCLREGVLEMLVCPKQTKEHESIFTLDGKAQVVHAGLLAAGAEPGHPARFSPEFVKAAGTKIDIFVNWIDDEGKPQRTNAQEWVRHATQRYFEAPLEFVPEGVRLAEGNDAIRYDDVNKELLFFGPMTPELKEKFLGMSKDASYQKAIESLAKQGEFKKIEADFVFAGSGFLDRGDGAQVYAAEGGSLICVANFGDALIDVNIKSSASNDAGLLFEPWTERVPPAGTEVLLELVPVPEAKGQDSETK